MGWLYGKYFDSRGDGRKDRRPEASAPSGGRQLSLGHKGISPGSSEWVPESERFDHTHNSEADSITSASLFTDAGQADAATVALRHQCRPGQGKGNTMVGRTYKLYTIQDSDLDSIGSASLFTTESIEASTPHFPPVQEAVTPIMSRARNNNINARQSSTGKADSVASASLFTDTSLGQTHYSADSSSSENGTPEMVAVDVPAAPQEAAPETTDGVERSKGGNTSRTRKLFVASSLSTVVVVAAVVVLAIVAILRQRDRDTTTEPSIGPAQPSWSDGTVPPSAPLSPEYPTQAPRNASTEMCPAITPPGVSQNTQPSQPSTVPPFSACAWEFPIRVETSPTIGCGSSVCQFGAWSDPVYHGAHTGFWYDLDTVSHFIAEANGSSHELETVWLDCLSCSSSESGTLVRPTNISLRAFARSPQDIGVTGVTEGWVIVTERAIERGIPCRSLVDCPAALHNIFEQRIHAGT